MRARHTLALPLLMLACAHLGCASDEAGGVVDTVPAALKQIEGDAEGAYDEALAGHVAAVAKVAATIDTGWKAFRVEAEAAGGRTEDLAAMDAAIAGLVSAAANTTDAILLARAANAVSGPMDELFALYEAPVPPAVLALDYLGREVVLDARQADYAGADQHVSTIEATFATFRAELVADGGEQDAKDYDASVAAMREDVKAPDAKKLEADANVGLELVDAMEGVFSSAAEAESEEEDD